jgi:CheY-like chemotaxis protein
VPVTSGHMPEPAPLAPLRILLVEDSEDNRLLVRSYLRGHTLEEAENGQIAVDMFVAGRFDVVLMDVQMPVMDGYAATGAMRAWERERGARPTPILALTAHHLPEEIQRSLAAGCDDHLTKPIRKATLLRAIERHVTPDAAATDAAKAAVPPEVEQVRVRVDESLRDLAPGYLENRRRDLPRLAAALTGGDWETIRVIGHNVKGTGAGYGFDAISRIGAALEVAAKAHDSAEIGARVDELTRYLNGVVIDFQ